MVLSIYIREGEVQKMDKLHVKETGTRFAMALAPWFQATIHEDEIRTTKFSPARGLHSTGGRGVAITSALQPMFFVKAVGVGQLETP